MQRAGWGFVPQPALSFCPAVCLRFLEDNTDNGDNRIAVVSSFSPQAQGNYSSTIRNLST